MPGVTPVIPEPTPGPQACTSNTLGNLQSGWVPESLGSHTFDGGHI